MVANPTVRGGGFARVWKPGKVDTPRSSDVEVASWPRASPWCNPVRVREAHLMKALAVLGVVLCLVGLVWIGQGVGWIGGSFMTGRAIWAVIGFVALFIGAILIRIAGSIRRSERDDLP